jgi:hypothetical protein
MVQVNDEEVVVVDNKNSDDKEVVVVDNKKSDDQEVVVVDNKNSDDEEVVVVDDKKSDDQEIVVVEEKKRLAKLDDIEAKKRKKFEKKIFPIIENLDVSFTFKELNSYERKIVHEMAAKYKLYHLTINEKITISRVEHTKDTYTGVTPETEITDVNEVSEMMDKVQITGERPGYNLRSKKMSDSKISPSIETCYYTISTSLKMRPLT